MKIWYRLDALIEIRHIILFIRRMQVIAVQSKTHKNDLYSQHFFKKGTNGNTAPTPHRDWIFPKGSLDGLGGGLIGLAADGGHIGLSAMMLFCLDSNAGGSYIPEIVQ